MSSPDPAPALGTTPILVVPCWGSGMDSYMPLLQALRKRHETVLCSMHKRRGGKFIEPAHRKFGPLGIHARETLQFVMAQFPSLSEIILLGNSMGGAVAKLVAVELQKERNVKVRLIQVCSAWVYPDTVRGLTKRMTHKVIEDLRKDRALRHDPTAQQEHRRFLADGMVYARRNPWRALMEGVMLARRSEEGVAIGPDIDTYWVAGQYDPLYPAAEQREALEGRGIRDMWHFPDLIRPNDQRLLVLPMGHDPHSRTDTAEELVGQLHKYRLLTL